LIVYSIEAAMESGVVEKVIVSTDCEKTAEISRLHGAEVPFIRPQYLARDDSRGIDVVLHAIEWLEQNAEPYDIVTVLQPTSPLRTAEDIKSAFRMLESKKADAVVSVVECEHSPLWANIIPKDHSLSNFISEDLVNRNRQELDTYYRLNGAIYMGWWNYVKENKGWFSNKSYAYIMPRIRSVDIDDEIDFNIVSNILNMKGKI
jgi:N-acylneuraminate cytidylyltransferase/CMP-N,N'-diacetyllegionaminic acid synthase